MFKDAFDISADRPCLRDAQRTLRYGEVLALGRSLIAGLPRARSLVVLRCSVTIEAVAAYVALMADGHVPLLLEDSLAETLVQNIVGLYRPDAVVDPQVGIVARSAEAPSELHPDLALLLTTSGSTGSPKLVRLSHAGLRANAEAIAEYLSLDANERPLLHLPISYSYGLSILHSHFAVGACVGLTRSTVMEPGYWNDLRAFEATSVSGVPFFYTALRRFGEVKLDIPHLRTLTQAGGRLDPKIVTIFADWAGRTGRRFVVMYGQTEAGPRISYVPPDKVLTAPDAIGVPIKGVTIELRDEAGGIVPDGIAGEMIVRSPAVMLGYAQEASDLARGDDLGGVLATGDLAQRGPDGLLRIVGRRSRIVKVFGLRVNVDEIETRLAERGLAAFGFGLDDKLRVLIETATDAAEARKTIIETFSLPPSGIEVRVAVEPVERSGSGKVTAAALSAAWDKAAP